MRALGQAAAIYQQTDVHGAEKRFLGPMCFRDGDLPHVPPPPPSPPGFALLLGSGSCLVSDGRMKTPITVSDQCAGAKKWHLLPQPGEAQHVCASPPARLLRG